MWADMKGAKSSPFGNKEKHNGNKEKHNGNKARKKTKASKVP